MASYERRLPVYLLLDCSESMAGEAIQDVGRGIHEMISALRSDPVALESVWLSVITFSRYAKQVVPLTELMQFKPPTLSVRTGTAMGAALKLMQECLGRDVTKTTPTTKGDYKPLVFLFTDGQPTDEWESAADMIRAQHRPGIANIYAIGCGPDVDTGILRSVTDIVLMMSDTSSEAWRKVFIWLTASVQTSSKALDDGGEGQAVNLPALPDILSVAAESDAPRDPRPHQVFLHARCGKSGNPYLMRFARRGDSERYVALCSHPLEVEEGDGGEELPPINTALLDGVPDCPYCENPTAVACGCGAIICSPDPPRDVLTCPQCHQQSSLSDDQGGFDVRQSEG